MQDWWLKTWAQSYSMPTSNVQQDANSPKVDLGYYAGVYIGLCLVYVVAIFGASLFQAFTSMRAALSMHAGLLKDHGSEMLYRELWVGPSVERSLCSSRLFHPCSCCSLPHSCLRTVASPRSTWLHCASSSDSSRSHGRPSFPSSTSRLLVPRWCARSAVSTSSSASPSAAARFFLRCGPQPLAGDAP